MSNPENFEKKAKSPYELDRSDVEEGFDKEPNLAEHEIPMTDPAANEHGVPPWKMPEMGEDLEDNKDKPKKPGHTVH